MKINNKNRGVSMLEKLSSNYFLPLAGVILIGLLGCSSDSKISSKLKNGKLLIETGNSENAVDNDSYRDPNAKLSPIEAFEFTAYPFVKKRCGGCHNTTNKPFFASDDIQIAFDELYTGQKIDPVQIKRSRLALRLEPENHYCWAPGCPEAAKEMKLKLQDWVDEITDGTIAKLKADAIRFLSTESFTISPGSSLINPDLKATGGVILEAEAGVIAGGAAANNAKASGGSQVNLDKDDSVTFTFNVAKEGNYNIFVSAVNPEDYSLEFNFNNQDKATGKDIALPDPKIDPAFIRDDFHWNRVNTLSANLVAGENTVKVTATLALALDRIFIVPSVVFKFDLSKIQEVKLSAKGSLEFEAKVYDANSYIIENLAVWLDSGSVEVKGVRIIMNGSWDPDNATYTSRSLGGGKTIKSPGEVISEARSLMAIEKGLKEDKFSIQFEEIK
jgi:hypothetical protein